MRVRHRARGTLSVVDAVILSGLTRDGCVKVRLGGHYDIDTWLSVFTLEPIDDEAAEFLAAVRSALRLSRVSGEGGSFDDGGAES